MKYTKKEILEKHIAIFFNVNKLARFEDIPHAIFHNAMNEYAKQESAELLEALIEIKKGEKAYNTDKLIRVNNTIEDMKSIAEKAIKKTTE